MALAMWIMGPPGWAEMGTLVAYNVGSSFVVFLMVPLGMSVFSGFL